MKKEEALQAVALLNGLSDALFDLFLVEWSILMVPARPIVTRTRIITDALPWLKDVFQFTVQDLVIDHSWFHIDDYCPRFQIIYHGTSLKVNLPILSRINITEEAAQCLIVH